VSTLNIAHRGASIQAPQNTEAAFALAVYQGADMIETDLHLLADGAVPLVHDSEIGGDEVGELTLAALRERLPDVPTLEETLDRFGARIAFNLEIKKGTVRHYPGLARRTLDEVRKRDLLDRTLFSSFYDPVLEEIRGLAPAARIGLLLSPRFPKAIFERAERLRADAIHPELSMTTRELVEEAHRRGYRVHVYTVDETADLERLVSWGVDGIFTNLPERLRAILRGV
jgi:glycerophosphoryl diester phosphodiesterase